MMTVRLIAHTPEPEKVVAAAAKLCYSDAHITDLLDGLTEEKTAKFLTMLSDLGHASPIEHASFTFGIEGVSRTLLAQITRHRIASFSVQSQRYVRLDDFRYVTPPEIEAIPEAKAAFLASMEEDAKRYLDLAHKLEEGHTARLMVWETLYCAAAAIVGGLAAGVLLSKLVLLLLLQLSHLPVEYGFEISLSGMADTAALFGFLFLLTLNNLALLGMGRLRTLINLVTAQGILLGGLLLIHDHALLAVAVLLIKGGLLPWLLHRTRRQIGADPHIKPRLGFGLAVLTGLACLVFSLWLEGRLPMTPGLFPPLLLPAGLTTLFCGLLLVVGRATALSQVMGYLVAENGIFLLGIPLMTAGAVWFELTLLLDIFVAVFVMGIAINHISHTFESIDVGFHDLRD